MSMFLKVDRKKKLHVESDHIYMLNYGSDFQFSTL